MGPILAESIRRPFGLLLGALLASVVAIAMATPPVDPPREHRYSKREYKQFKRVGKCINGKRVWVYQ